MAFQKKVMAKGAVDRVDSSIGIRKQFERFNQLVHLTPVEALDH